MNYKDVRDFALLMDEMGLTLLEFSAHGASLKLQRGLSQAAPNADVKQTAVHPEQSVENPAQTGGFTVKSPMVGVFYSAPGADKDPYVSIGDTIHAGDVLCIIEAMKIMNEITAERDGIISEILAEDRQVVEFGQPLFRIDLA